MSRTETSGHAAAPGAVILGGALGSLAAARSLGRRGIPVYFISNDNRIAGLSRYVRRSLLWPGPDSPRAVPFLLDLARQDGLDGWLLIAAGDPEMKLLAQNGAELRRSFRVLGSDWSAVEGVYDKALVHLRAEALGLGTPRSYEIADRAALLDTPFVFPVVLKPAVRETVNAFTLAKAWKAETRAQLLALYDRAVAAVGSEAVVVQEFIPGGGASQISYAALWREGAPVASLTAARLRQYPLEFGYTSTFVKTVDVPEAKAEAERLLDSVGYSGLVEVEFKYDARDGRYKLLDVNTRIWNWLSLGAAVGIDFPFLAWAMSTGAAMPLVPSVAAEACWVHASRDLAAAALSIVSGRISVGDYLRSFRGKRSWAVFAWDDPLPALLEPVLVSGRVVRRRLTPLLGRRALSVWRGGARALDAARLKLARRGARP